MSLICVVVFVIIIAVIFLKIFQGMYPDRYSTCYIRKGEPLTVENMENLRAWKSESTDLPDGFEERLSMKSNNSPTFQNKKKY